MRPNRVKQVMREGQLALGAYVTLADPQIVEIIGLSGFDAAFIDMEHTDFDLPLISQMIRAADLAGVTSVIRVPDNDAKLILRLLDMGAEGIIVPHVAGIEGAQKAVDAVRYPPLGHRVRRRQAGLLCDHSRSVYPHRLGDQCLAVGAGVQVEAHGVWQEDGVGLAVRDVV